MSSLKSILIKSILPGILTSILTLNFSCSGDVKEGQFTINISEQEPFENLSEIFESLRYIPLETKVECQIREVLKLHYDGKRIYILNNVHPERTLLTFDSNGAFLFKAGNTEGPGKITRCNDFWVDDTTGNIDLLDRYQKKIVRFDKAGNYLTALPTRNAFDQFRPLPDGNYIFFSGSEFVSGGNDKVIHLTSPDFQIMKSFISLSGSYNLPEYSETNFSNNNQYPIFFKQHFSNIIYKISKDGLFPLVDIDFGNDWIGNSMLEKIASADDMGKKMNFINSHDHIDNIEFFDKAGNCFFFTYYHKANLYWNLYNPVASSLKSTERKYEQVKTNDIDGGIFPFSPVSVYEDEIIFLLEPDDLLEKLQQLPPVREGESKQTKSSAFLNMLERIKPHDNPILVFAKVKCH